MIRQGKVSEKFKTFISKDIKIAIFLFILAVVIRAIPEIKAGIWPIGYDTFNTYAAEISSYSGPLFNWVKTANIIYFAFLPFKALGMDPNLIVKILGPIFYGGLIVSFYCFVRGFIKFNYLKAFLVCFLLIFQLAALRIGWDLYRNEISLIFFFWALIYLPKITQPKYLFYFTFLAILTVLSNQLVTVVFLVILLIYILAMFFRKKWEETVAALTSLIISSIVFIAVLNSSGQVLYDPHIIFTSEKNYFWRYFYRYDLIMSYNQLFETIVGLFWLIYVFILPFALYGFWRMRKNLVLTTISFWLLLGTFSSLIFVGRGLLVWDRWLFMLVFPFSIYAVEAIFHLGKVVGNWKKWSHKIPILAKSLTIIFWLGFFGIIIWRAIPFLTEDYLKAKPPLANDKLNSYFPRTMVHNSLGLWGEIESTLDCIEWFNKNTPSGSIIVVDNRYRGLMITYFDIDNRYILTNSWKETLQRSNLEIARDTGLKPVYIIWNISSDIDGFDRVMNFGNRGIYKALPEFYEE